MMTQCCPVVQPAPDTRALPQQPSYSQSRPSVPSAAADTWTGAEATLGSLTADDHSTQGTHSSPLDFGVAAISPGAPINERIVHVHQQLSSIGNKVVLLNRFKLAGRDERCNGGGDSAAILHAFASCIYIDLRRRQKCRVSDSVRRLKHLSVFGLGDPDRKRARQCQCIYAEVI